jgi:membrane-bound ClpP family serine protease
MRLTWHRLAAVGAATVVLLLVAHSVAGVALAGVLVLTPVMLFGLVEVPRSLWPAMDLELSFAAPILGRAGLFQRPPPVSLQ